MLVLLCPLTAAAFPTTGVLDSFNRANENPLANGTWGGSIDAGKQSLELINNVVLGFTDVSADQSYWSAQTFGPDTESFFTVSTLPGTDNDNVSLYLRITSPGTATVAYYRFGVTRAAGLLNSYFIRRHDTNGNDTSLFSGSGTTIATGDKFGASVVGSTAAIWVQHGSAAWVQVTSVVDGTPLTGAGNIGMSESQSVTANIAIAAFGGGTVNTTNTPNPPGQPQIGSPTLNPVNVTFPIFWNLVYDPTTGLPVTSYNWTAGFNDGSFNTSGSVNTNSMTLTMPYHNDGQAASAFFCVVTVGALGNSSSSCNSFTVPGPAHTFHLSWTSGDSCSIAGQSCQFSVWRCSPMGCANFAQIGTAPQVNNGVTQTFVDTTAPLDSCYKVRDDCSTCTNNSNFTTTVCTSSPPSDPTGLHFTSFVWW